MQSTRSSNSLRSWLAVDRNALFTALLGLVFAVGIGLRLYDLSAESYWLDEITMVRLSAGSFDVVFDQIVRGRPPLFVLLAYGWVQLFGTSEFVARLLPAAASIAALFLFYRVARELFDRQVALIALSLMAISEFLIYHAQNFRYYSLFLLMTLLSYFWLLRFLQKPSARNLALYVLTTALMYYTHSYGLFIIMAQGLYFLTQWFRLPQVRLRWFVSQVLIGLSILYSFLIFFRQTTDGSAAIMEWIPQITPVRLAVILLRYIFPGREYPSMAVLALGLLFLLTVAVWFITRKGWAAWLRDLRDVRGMGQTLTERPNELVLTLLWFASPIVVPIILSYLFGPVFLGRYAICATPALFMLIALALVSLQKVLPPLAVIGLIAIWVAPGLAGYYRATTNEEWREVAAYVDQRAASNDIVLFAPAEMSTSLDKIIGPSLARSFNWYYHGNLPNCSLSEDLSGEAALTTAFKQCAAGKDRFWLVLRGDPHRIQPYISLFLEKQVTGTRLVEQRMFVDINLYLFELAGS